MLFKYHKLMKTNEMDLLRNDDKEKLIDIIKLIAKRPFYSFFVYQVTGSLDDVEAFYEDALWLMHFLDKFLDYMQEKYWPATLVNIIQWLVGGPCLVYFWVVRFFICLFRWHKYYRESSLILLKIC